MYVLGITGGIGSGKTEAANMIKKMTGAELLLSDELGHRVMEPGEDCYYDVLSLFGNSILDTDESLNRNAISNIIFNDPSKKKALENIIHPAVKQYIAEFIKERKDLKGIIVLESAILFESGADSNCDEVWFIDADDPVRRERLKNSRGYSDKKISTVFARQSGYKENRKKCSLTIKNNGTAQELRNSISKALMSHKR